MQLYFFRPGEAVRTLARCQIGLRLDGQCGLGFTYPWPTMPWRRNPKREFKYLLEPEVTQRLFAEVHRLRSEHPEECLDNSNGLWADSSEKANSITRNAAGKLCVTVGIIRQDGSWEEYYSLREDSPAWLSSLLCQTLAGLMAPHERLSHTFATSLG